MTRASRRRFLQGAGLVAAATALPLSSPSQRSAAATTDLPTQTGDLTIRWRHLRTIVDRSDLVAAWPMDEGVGYRCRDVANHGHTLYVIGSDWNTSESGLTGAVRRPGWRGGGCYLHERRWLRAKGSDGFNVGNELTISAWVRLDALPSVQATVLANGPAYSLTVRAAGTARLAVRDSADRQHVVESPDGSLSPGRWVHVAATANAATGHLVVYLNGAVAAAQTSSPYTPAESLADLTVGRGMRGCLDEVSLHKSELGADAIQQLYIVGLPKVYTQTRETIDADRKVWTSFHKGSEPVPHPVLGETVFLARYDNSARSEQGDAPTSGSARFVPGRFGGALRADGAGLTYESPLTTDTGTVEMWCFTVEPETAQTPRTSVFRASGASQSLDLYRSGRRWSVDIGGLSLHGPTHSLTPDELEHVAVTWGGGSAALYVNGVPVVEQDLGDVEPRFDRTIEIGTAGGGGPLAIDDLRISANVRPWGMIGPRGQAVTDAAGLDLRDGLDRPDGALPLWWRPASGTWTHQTRGWVDVTPTGDDPIRRRALRQSVSSGLHPIYHPDAFGHASSIEAGVEVESLVNGWAGIFVQASEPGTAFTAHTFSINPASGKLRLARCVDGAVGESKVLPYDFPTRAKTTYELTLTATGDGVLRGFVDGINTISLRLTDDAPTQGYAGLFTHGTPAHFDNVHFTALTPAADQSRLIDVRVIAEPGATPELIRLDPFHWHKRRGALPWRHTDKDPEAAGNIAGADTATPERPIPPAFWRSEDSANSDLITVDGRVIYFMRGNPRVDNHSYGARIGALDTTVDRFDGIHFDDPSIGIDDLEECKLVQGQDDLLYPEHQDRTPQLQVNNSGSAYIGDGRLLVFFNETRNRLAGCDTSYRRLAYACYDARANDWIHKRSQYVPWSTSEPDVQCPRNTGPGATPELVSLRDPDSDEYRVVLYNNVRGADDVFRMTMTGLAMDPDGVPQPDPDLPMVTSIRRSRSPESIYNFRVLFDNGIYYLHYSEGALVPDWPTNFTLCAALDPYAGPWIRNAASDAEGSTYFRRGTEFEPDNAAIWQGCMFKHRGRYYMYYENYHTTGPVDDDYFDYDHPHCGSRVGYATAN